MKKLIAALILAPNIAFAQGYINPPVYATGAIYAQPGTDIVTPIKNAVSPGNMNVYNAGPITNWTIIFPFPTFDGQLITISCPNGNVPNIVLQVPAGATSTIQSGGPTSCTTSVGSNAVWQYRGEQQIWTLVSYTNNQTTFPSYKTLVYYRDSYHPDAAPDFLQTTGYAVDGDLGAALYVKDTVSSTCGFSITLANSSVVYYRLTGNIIRPEMCGPTNPTATDATSMTNNAAAIQAANDYFKGTASSMQGGKVIMGSYTINTTIEHTSGVTFEGTGWSNPYAPTATSNMSFIRWGGSVVSVTAGSFVTNKAYKITAIGTTDFTLIGARSNTVGTTFIATGAGTGTGTADEAPTVWRISSLWGAGLKGMAFGVVNGSSSPYAAIQFGTPGTAAVIDGTRLEQIYIGPLQSNIELTKYQNAIAFDGTINGDTATMTNIIITACNESGIVVRNPNASGILWNTLRVGLCANAFDMPGANNAGAQHIVSNLYAHVSDYLFRLGTGAKLSVYGFASETSGGLLKVEGPQAQLHIRDGAYQLTTDMLSHGRIIDTQTYNNWTISLENYSHQYNGATVTPSFRMYNTSGSVTYGSFRLTGGCGIPYSILNLGSIVFYTDSRDITFAPAQCGYNGPVNSARFIGNWAVTADRSPQPFRTDSSGKTNILGGPLAVRQVFRYTSGPTVTASIGSGATTYSYKITSLDVDGNETDASPATTVTNAATLSAGVAENTITWPFIPGAVSYKIYGRTSGSELYLATVTWNGLNTPLFAANQGTWTDNGSIVPSGAAPTVNATGNIIVDGMLTAGRAISSSTSVAAGTTVSAGTSITATTTVTGTTGLRGPRLRSDSSGNTDLTGTITLSGGAGSYTFTDTYTTAPICMAQSQTNPINLVGATATTTAVTFAGTGADTIKYICIGRN